MSMSKNNTSIHMLSYNLNNMSFQNGTIDGLKLCSLRVVTTTKLENTSKIGFDVFFFFSVAGRK